MQHQQSAEFAKLATGFYLEGLSVDHQRGTVWCSDVVGGGLQGVKAAGDPVATLNPDRKWTGGILMNADGTVLSSGRGGIMWNDPQSGASGWLLDTIEGAPINGINEMAPDGTGGIFFGTVDLDMVIRGETPRATALYRLTPDRQAVLLADGMGFTNGMMFDPGRKRLYCNDTFSCTWAFDVAADFSLSNKRLFLKKEDADGMALDAAGNVWISGFGSSDIARVTPDGQLLDPFPTPAGPVTQIRFGGADMRDVYLATVSKAGADSLKHGRPIETKGSLLIRVRSDIAGQPVEPANFTLDKAI